MICYWPHNKYNCPGLGKIILRHEALICPNIAVANSCSPCVIVYCWLVNTFLDCCDRLGLFYAISYTSRWIFYACLRHRDTCYGKDAPSFFYSFSLQGPYNSCKKSLWPKSKWNPINKCFDLNEIQIIVQNKKETWTISQTCHLYLSIRLGEKRYLTF